MPIEPSNSVSARYRRFTFPYSLDTTSGDKIVDFDQKVHDSHNAVTTGVSWKFTAPISGKYLVNAKVARDSSTNAFLEIHVTNAITNIRHVILNRHDEADGVAVLDASGSAVLHLNAGDAIAISILASTNPVVLATNPDHQYVDITRLGD